MSYLHYRSSENCQIPIGGKVNIARSLRKANKGFSKSMSEINPMAHAVKDPVLNKAMRDIGKYTQKEILPAVVSTGIPVASTALGALASMYGGPVAGEMVSSMSQGLMEEYIPKKYQSDNPYIGMMGDAISMGMSGDMDMDKAMMMQKQFTSQVSKDLSRPQRLDRQQYNIAPYSVMMGQILKDYTNSEIEPSNNEIVTSSINQKRGSIDALLGSGIKKRRGRPKKIIDENEIEIVVKKRLPHKKFTHAKNKSLDQLLEAYAEREEKDNRLAMKDMIDRQTRMLKELGY